MLATAFSANALNSDIKLKEGAAHPINLGD